MNKLDELIEKKNYNLEEKDTKEIKLEFFKHFSKQPRDKGGADNFTRTPDDKYFDPTSPDMKDLDRGVVNSDNAIVFFNGALFAYTYLILNEILRCYSSDNPSRLTDGLLFKGSTDLAIKKKELIKTLLDTYDIVCLNECHDDLIDDLIDVSSSKIMSEKTKDLYSAIVSTKIPVRKVDQNVKNTMGGELVHGIATHNEATYNIICHHAPSFKEKRTRGRFRKQLEEIKKLKNLIYCVDSNSPYTIEKDIEEKNLNLVAPENINELVHDETPENKTNDPEGLKTSDNYNTTNKTRTWMQPQLDKADQLDKSSKDFIICSINLFMHGESLIKTTDKDKTSNNRVSIPNADFPFDHFIVTANIKNMENMGALRRVGDVKRQRLIGGGGRRRTRRGRGKRVVRRTRKGNRIKKVNGKGRSSRRGRGRVRSSRRGRGRGRRFRSRRR
tara:strand:+ start:7282 stop:8610 length:1329 start_codon:yes stop_codon:yes gene_type:complete